MLSEKTTQKILFVWLIFLFLLTTRVLLATRAGVFLCSLAIVGFTLWMTFRVVEHLVAGTWKMSGTLAAQVLRKPVEAASAEQKRLGE